MQVIKRTRPQTTLQHNSNCSALLRQATHAHDAAMAALNILDLAEYEAWRNEREIAWCRHELADLYRQRHLLSVWRALG